MTDATPHARSVADARGPAIGKDEWVARHGERRARPRPAARRRRGAPPPRAVVGLARCSSSAAFACSPSSRASGYVRRVAFDTVLYMLLALGLNVVVGWGGLLDLGYVAFYGIGAYTYALFNSRPVRHPPADARHDPDRRHRRRRSSGFLLGLPSTAADRRLPRDRDALLPAALPDRRDERRPDLRATTSRAAPNGILQRRPAAPLRPHARGRSTRASSRSSYFYVALAVFAVVYVALHFVNHSRTGRAWRSLREDPLAAEAMGMPVNRLKLMASPSARPSRRSPGRSSRR